MLGPFLAKMATYHATKVCKNPCMLYGGTTSTHAINTCMHDDQCAPPWLILLL